jgi:repressor LexA
MSLSPRQEKILDFIRSYHAEHDYPPTIREIGKAAGITSTSVVKYNLERLQEKGMISRNKEVSRGLRLVDHTPPGMSSAGMVAIPKYGRIAAGIPIGAAGQQDNPFAGETLTLPEDLVSSANDLYALQVQGDSMIDAMVNDGDWVVIHHQLTAAPHDMVVAWIKDREETTLKYYHPEGDMVRLMPANPTYQPIPVRADQLEIQGKVVGIWRQIA